MTVTHPQGFVASAAEAGLKSGRQLDVAIVVNDGPLHVGTGLFTTNRLRAAPVIWSEEVCAKGSLKAIVLNSGNANSCVGELGRLAVDAEVRAASAALERTGRTIAVDHIATCSTGKIGVPIDIDALTEGIHVAATSLGSSDDNGRDAAVAIMTTDTVPKEAVYEDPAGWSIGAMAKGSGMISPDLATMLVVITTDAEASAEQLRQCIDHEARLIFNRMTVDGSTSTNDSVIAMASGASGCKPDKESLHHGISNVMHQIVHQILHDAEGATKIVTVSVQGLPNDSMAESVARRIASDLLVRISMNGEDPNWTRIAVAAGAALPKEYDPKRMTISINDVLLCDLHAASEKPVMSTRVDMTQEGVFIGVDFLDGTGSALAYTCDLSHEYISLTLGYADTNTTHSTKFPGTP